MDEYRNQMLFQRILENAGPYKWWMFGMFIASLALVLIPSNVVVPILRNYYSPDVPPALGILQAYHRAASIAQILYWIAIVITVSVQLFFLVKTIIKSARHIVGALILAVVFLGFFGWLVSHSNVFDYGRFLERVAQDIQQFEEGNLETEILHLSPRNLSVNVIGPLDPLVNYATPIQVINGIRPAEGGTWQGYMIPLVMEFERNSEREFNERRSVSQNLEEAQLYRFTFTSNLRLVYSIELVTLGYFLAQRIPSLPVVGYVDSALLGGWYLVDNPSWIMVMIDDNLGLRGEEGDMLLFSWGISNDILLMYTEYEFGRITSYLWDYEFDGDELWLTSRRGLNAVPRIYRRSPN